LVIAIQFFIPAKLCACLSSFNSQKRLWRDFTMAWDDESIRSRFSRGAYTTLLGLLASGDTSSELSGLQTLADTLAYGDANLLSSFPVSSFCQHMTRLLTSPVGAVQETSALCIYHVLEAHPNSARELLNAGCLAVMHYILSDTCPVGTASNLLHAADLLSQFRPGELAQHVGISPLLNHFNMLPVVDQRVIAKTIAQITSQAGGPAFVSSLPVILTMIQSADQTIVRHSLNSFCAIAARCDPGRLPIDSVAPLCEAIAATADPRTSLRLFQVLSRASMRPRISQVVIDSGLDFTPFLLSGSELAQTAVEVILHILPSNRVPKVVLPNHRSEGVVISEARRFASSIQPLLLRCLIERLITDPGLIVALGITIRLRPLDVPEALLNVMCGLTQRPNISHQVMFLAQAINRPDLVAASGLLGLLRSASRDGGKWYNSTLRRLSARTADADDFESVQLCRLRTLRDVIAVIMERKLGAFQLLQDGFLDVAVDLVAASDDVLFEPLVVLLIELLMCLPLTELEDASLVDDFKNRQRQIRVEHGGGRLSCAFLPVETLAGAEAIYNYHIQSVTHAQATAAWRASGRLATICPLPSTFAEMSCAEIGSFHRIYRNQSYKFIVFRSGRVKLSAKDFAIRQRANDFVATVDEEQDPFAEMAEYSVPTTNVDAKMLSVLKVLAAVHARIPMKSSEKVEARIWASLKAANHLVALAAPGLQIVANFPFLFSFEMRSFVLAVSATDVLSGLSAFTRRTAGTKLVDNHNHVKVFLARDNVFEDGVCLLEAVGVTLLHFEVSFVGEEGIGIGPTQEFFTLFAKELTVAGRSMWRSQTDGEFAFHKQGLFPCFAADPKLFFLLGVLCGKAMQMGFLVPIPFSCAFFRLVKGERIEIEEVDRELAESLRALEGLEGLPFVVPGTDVELKANGKAIVIDSGNFGEFRNLLIDFVCGSKVAPHVNAFRKGLGNLFQPGCWELVSAQEMSVMISGTDGADLTMLELIENIDVSNGYVAASPQIRMLFELLLEMAPADRALFFKFVTGADRLPVGGLQSLRPRLTVARKIGCAEGSLPSVMTCTNYFKLPDYETKETMRAKLMQAIWEGQGEFWLT
jgi:E3 ubiquitin-protein ligase TRIP12